MTRVIPFKKEHIECMEIREYEQNTTLKIPQLQIALQSWEQSNNAGTLIHDGRVIAILGFWELWSGVCELYVLPSVYTAKYPLAFAKTAKRILESGIFNNYRRIQIQAPDDELHNRWVKFLKFEKEGTFKKYDQLGNDLNMWARVK